MRKILLALALALALLAGSAGMAGASEVTTAGPATAGPATASAGTAAASAPRRPVVHDALGWNQDLTRPSFLGALVSPVPPKAIDASFVLENLRWSAWARGSAHGTGRIGWAQPGPGGNGISRQAPVTVTLYAVATHDGRRYFSRLAFSFTWRGHKYAGTDKFADPCGNTTGCWVAPGTPVA
jgi:hypothetical protein